MANCATKTAGLCGNPPESPDSSTVPRAAYDTLSAAYDSLTAAHAHLWDAYRGAVETASIAYTGWMRAEGQLSQERTEWSEEREAWRLTVKKLKPSRIGLYVGPGLGVTVGQGRVVYGPTLAVGVRFKL